MIQFNSKVMTFEEFRDEWLSDKSYIDAQTSGSTGSPKRIKLDKEFVAASARATNSFFSLGSCSRLHSCVAADFIGGKMMLVRSIISGGIFSWENPSNRPLEGFSKSDRIDLLAVVPSQMLHILDHLDRMPSIGAIIIGGSAIHDSLRKRIVASGLCCYETYGMTETSSHIALRKIDSEKAGLFEVIGELTLGLDERGCLTIEYPTGYRVVTNDMAELFGVRNFNILGRADDIIVTGGKKLNPFDVEAELGRISEVECYVSSQSDDKWGEMVVVVVESKENVIKLRESMPYFTLPHWMLPKKIVKVDAFPRTPNGKIHRMKLRDIIRKIM